MAARGGDGTARLVKPQLTKLVDAPPDGPEWLHEIKFDGYRMHAGLDVLQHRFRSSSCSLGLRRPILARDRFARDSPLEGDGLELRLPHHHAGREVRAMVSNTVPSPIFTARIRFGWVGPASHC